MPCAKVAAVLSFLYYALLACVQDVPGVTTNSHMYMYVISSEMIIQHEIF